METDIIKVLQVNADNFGAGGISVIIWRIMETLKEENITMSFLTQCKNRDEDYVKQVVEQGGKVHYIQVSSNVIFRYYDRYRKFYKLIKKSDYNIVHINGNESFGIISYVLAAKKAKCKIVIHAHSTKFKNEKYIFIKKILKLFFQPSLINNADCMLACSLEAAKFMYGKAADKAIIVKNGLDPKLYAFDSEARKSIRADMLTNEKIVIGHIGRFVYPKNHEFILDVFEQILKMNLNAELWLIGEKSGEEYEKICVKTKQGLLNGRVKFVGNTSKIKEYLSAMDAFLFPSRFEGLPLALIEAQVNGVPIVCSDVITDEAIFSSNVMKISLKAPSTQWAEKILEAANREREYITDGNIKSDFDITNVSKIVLGEYKKLVG